MADSAALPFLVCDGIVELLAGLEKTLREDLGFQPRQIRVKKPIAFPALCRLAYCLLDFAGRGWGSGSGLSRRG
jgi:hypothetical protein